MTTSRIPRNAAAERALISTSALLCLSISRDENFELWVDVLADASRLCQGIGETLMPLRAAVDDLVAAKGRNSDARAVDACVDFLRSVLRQYFIQSSADSYQVLVNQLGGKKE